MVAWKKKSASPPPGEAKTPSKINLSGDSGPSPASSLQQSHPYPGHSPEATASSVHGAELGLLQGLPAFPESGLMAGAFLFTRQG